MGAQNIHPHPPPLENAFWPEKGGGGGGIYNFSLEYFYVLVSGVCEYSHCIHTGGGGEGVTTYLRRFEFISKRIPQKVFPVFARVRI